MYCFDRTDWNAFNNYLCNVDWLTIFSNCSTVDEYWLCFHEILINCFDMFVPTIECNSRMAKQKRPKYSLYIRKCLNKKALAWKLYSKFRTAKLKLKYNSLVTQCQIAIERFHAANEDHLIEGGNLGAFYKFVNSKTSTRAGVSPLVNSDGDLIYEDVKKAEILNTFFTSVFSKDNGIFPPQSQNSNPITPFTGVYCSPLLVEKSISKMKTSKSSGEDKLPMSVLKKLSRPIAIPLSLIFNLSLSTSTLPAHWKSAVVSPVFKKGSASDPSNYRPISLTSTSCKILESILKDNIIDHLLINGLLSKQQHGFLAKRSTITQLLDCCKDWMQNINRNSQTDIIYLDFAKAFDSVVHSKLLLKLERYGIDGLTLKWINAFLTNRTQKVKVGSYMSSSSIVTSGVPQGSVLGPVLFLIFMKDICNLPNFDANMILFADDVKLYRTLKD